MPDEPISVAFITPHANLLIIFIAPPASRLLIIHPAASILTPIFTDSIA
jgi:hypothetical protein